MSWVDTLFSCFFIPKPTLTEQNLPDQTGCVTIITGGYAGVGKELAKVLYQKNATVYIAGRSENKAWSAIKEIKSLYPSSDGRLEFLHLDLADLATIKPSAENFVQREQKLNVLVNNAGVMQPPIGSLDTHGHEVQMGTNVLGHYLFTDMLTPLLRKTAATAPANTVRVCWAASLATFISPKPGGVVWNAQTGQPKTYNNPLIDYAQSKAANVLLAYKYQALYPSIVSLAFNPGNLDSELHRHVKASLFMRISSFILSRPPVLGAYTELWAGWSEEAGKVENRNKYVGPWGQWTLVRKDIKEDEGVRERLWEWCEKETRDFR